MALKRKLAAIHDETAQGVVEFAFIAALLMLLFLGTVDYARFLYYDAAVISSARVGAETASNHCPFSAFSCGQTATATADSLVMWNTYCEATSFVKLYPQYNQCASGTSSTWTPTCVVSANYPSGCVNCTYDICVDHSSSPQVAVTVGYQFKPIAFLLSWAFTEQSCYSGDSTSVNHHTLCATSTGKVS